MDLQNELLRNSALNGPTEKSISQVSDKPRQTDPMREQDPRVSANDPSSNFANKYLEFMGGDESMSKSNVSKQLPP